MIRDLSTFFAALVAAAVLAAAPAQAFTIENTDANSSGGSNLMAPSPFNDPVKKTEDRNGGTRTQFGNTSIFVGPQSSPQADYQTGINRMFSPLGRPPN